MVKSIRGPGSPEVNAVALKSAVPRTERPDVLAVNGAEDGELLAGLEHAVGPAQRLLDVRLAAEVARPEGHVRRVPAPLGVRKEVFVDLFPGLVGLQQGAEEARRRRVEGPSLGQVAVLRGRERNSFEAHLGVHVSDEVVNVLEAVARRLVVASQGHEHLVRPAGLRTIACTNLACEMTYEVPSPGHATCRDLVLWAVDVKAEALWPAALRGRSEDLPSVPCEPPTESEVGLPDEMREIFG
ncbi:unnamed protein product [Ixodes persulcatus]